jgi:hypothetical protein
MKSIKPFLVTWTNLIDLVWFKWRYSAIFNSPLCSLWHLHWPSAVCQFQKVSFLKKTWRCKTILRGKGDSRLLYSGYDEIPVSHRMETEKCRKVYLMSQNHLESHYDIDNGFVLFWWFTFKFKKENGLASSSPALIGWAQSWPLIEFAGQYLYGVECVQLLHKTAQFSSLSYRNGVQASLLAQKYDIQQHRFKSDGNLC